VLRRSVETTSDNVLDFAHSERRNVPTSALRKIALDKSNKRVKEIHTYCRRYLATRNFVRFVPIALKVVTMAPAEVNMKNLVESLAQFCSKVEVGSPRVRVDTVEKGF